MTQKRIGFRPNQAIRLNLIENRKSDQFNYYLSTRCAACVYGAFAAGQDFYSIIVTKNFKLTLSYELIHGSYGMQKSSCC
jgi:hypothetical protein